MSDELVYLVPGLHCEHCRAAVEEEVGALPAVERVQVDLERKLVVVTGSGLDDDAVRTAIAEAGYEAEP